MSVLNFSVVCIKHINQYQCLTRLQYARLVVDNIKLTFYHTDKTSIKNKLNSVFNNDNLMLKMLLPVIITGHCVNKVFE